MSMNPIIALAAVIKSCSDAKTRVKQNKRLCGHLVDDIEALRSCAGDGEEQREGARVDSYEALAGGRRRRGSARAANQTEEFRVENVHEHICSARVRQHQQKARIAHGSADFCQSALNNAMLSSLSQRGEYKDPGEHPAHPSTTPSPTPPKPKVNTRTDGGIKPHEGDVKVLSWRARSDVLAKLWPVDENPFSWKGVSFEGGRVTKLWLDDNQLSGSIPKELGQLSALTDLQLNDNQLSGSIPKELGQLSALKDLRLHKNQLSGSIPKELGQLSAVTLLWLNNNQLSGSIPKELGQLSALMLLWLNNNRLSGSIRRSSGSCRRSRYCGSMGTN